jgi:hypothetical protein
MECVSGHSQFATAIRGRNLNLTVRGIGQYGKLSIVFGAAQ